MKRKQVVPASHPELFPVPPTSKVSRRTAHLQKLFKALAIEIAREKLPVPKPQKEQFQRRLPLSARPRITPKPKPLPLLPKRKKRGPPQTRFGPNAEIK